MHLIVKSLWITMLLVWVVRHVMHKRGRDGKSLSASNLSNWASVWVSMSNHNYVCAACVRVLPTKAAGGESRDLEEADRNGYIYPCSLLRNTSILISHRTQTWVCVHTHTHTTIPKSTTWCKCVIWARGNIWTHLSNTHFIIEKTVCEVKLKPISSGCHGHTALGQPFSQCLASACVCATQHANHHLTARGASSGQTQHKHSQNLSC